MSESSTRVLQQIAGHLIDLLEGLPQDYVADVLKGDPLVTSQVFVGFRPSAQSLRSPIVRHRLINLMERDVALTETFITRWQEIHSGLLAQVSAPVGAVRSNLEAIVLRHGKPAVRIAILIDKRRACRELVKPVDEMKDAAANPEEPPAKIRKVAPVKENADLYALRIDADKMKKRLHELEVSLRDAESRLVDTEGSLRAERKASRDYAQTLLEARRKLEKSEKTADRLARGRAAAEEEIAALKKAVKERDRKLIEKEAAAAAPARPPKESERTGKPSWTSAVDGLIKSGQLDAARAFCEEMRKSSSSGVHLHILLEKTYQQLRERDLQAAECRWLCDYMLKTGDQISAVIYACRSLETASDARASSVHFQTVLQRIDLSNPELTQKVRRAISSLRKTDAEADRRAQGILRLMGGDHFRLLASATDSIHPDKVLQLGAGSAAIQISTAGICAAIDRNDVKTVQAVRRGLAALLKTRPKLHASVLRNIEQADASCVRVLEEGSEPVVVDGSNVAWHEADGRPRLSNLLAMRTELRRTGFFPIYICADAALQYQIDSRKEYVALLASGAVLEAAGRTDADGMLVDEARRLDCALITNDRMLDWDPNGSVTKIQYHIDRFGVTIRS